MEILQGGYALASAGQPPFHSHVSWYRSSRFSSIAAITFCAVHFTPVACLESAYSRGHFRATKLDQLVTGCDVSRFALTYARSATASSASSVGPNSKSFSLCLRRFGAAAVSESPPRLPFASAPTKVDSGTVSRAAGRPRPEVPTALPPDRLNGALALVSVESVPPARWDTLVTHDSGYSGGTNVGGIPCCSSTITASSGLRRVR
mmetsp:Transcript_2276/g.9486  ORF Transcript_2276/g.9486 Transcript_2276/m.9486 type:complete len:205 (-) Transcript_2276:337-951(-)